MPWWMYCIIPAVFWGVANLVDQHLARKYFVNDATGLLATVGLFTMVSGALVVGYSYGHHDITAKAAIISIGLGLLFILSLVPYIKALQISEASVVIPLWQLSPIFTLIIAWIVLGETLSPLQVGAIILIVIAAMGLVYDFKKIKLDFKTLSLMLMACLGVGIFTVASRYFVQEIHWLLFSGLTMIGYGLFGVIAFSLKPQSFKNMVSIFKNNSRLLILVFIAMEVVSRSAMIFYQKALSIAPAAIVQTIVAGFTPLYIFVLTILFAFFTPDTIKKLTYDRVLAFHIFCILIMTIGLYLLLIKGQVSQ